MVLKLNPQLNPQPAVKFSILIWSLYVYPPTLEIRKRVWVSQMDLWIVYINWRRWDKKSLRGDITPNNLLLLFSSSVMSDSFCDSMDCTPGSSVPGILQARTLEWGTIAFSVWELNQMLILKTKLQEKGISKLQNLSLCKHTNTWNDCAEVHTFREFRLWHTGHFHLSGVKVESCAETGTRKKWKKWGKKE